MATKDGMDEQAADELLLYLDTTVDYYPKKKVIAANLLKMIKRGTYEHKLAPQAWSYVVDDAAKGYAKEWADVKDWATIFPASTRRITAQDLADRWYANAKAGRPEEV